MYVAAQMELTHVCATFQCAYNPTCNPFKMLACCNDLLVCISFQIIAEDFKKLIEGFSGDISADNALQVSVIRNGLVVHIYTNLMQQSIYNFGIQHLWRDIILMKFI